MPELRVNPLTFLGLVMVTVLAAVPEQTYGIPSLPGDFHPGMCHVRDSILQSSWFLGDVESGAGKSLVARTIADLIEHVYFI